MKKLFFMLPLVMSSVMGDTVRPVCESDVFRSGRRMVQLEVPRAQSLAGRAPMGEGAPFRVLDGTQVLWEGKAGESFDVTPQSSNVYLVSENAENVEWGDLAWKGAEQSTEGAAKHIVLRADSLGQGDAGPALRSLLGTAAKHCLQGGSATIELPKGEYHFYPGGALRMSYYISNHDQQNMQPVGLPIVGLKNLKINGNGSIFVFHGAMQPVLLMDSEGVELNDITIRHDAPYYNEGKIVKIENGKTTLEFGPQFRWTVKDGQYYLMGDGAPKRAGAVLAFEADGRMVATGKAGDMGWPSRAEQVAPNRVRFDVNAAKMGLKEGQILVLRHYGRPHPAMVMYHADNVTLNRVVFQDSQGMALIAQRSRDITINGGGCVCAPGRIYTVSADATHFSNCAGHISVTGALYEGMMDDAINVHSTCLSIAKVASPTEIIARYMHGQAVGFEVFAKGENIQFIRGETLENHHQLGKVAEVEWLNEHHLRIVLETPLPEGIGVGDAIENADWYPSVSFIDSTVQHNRARGTLFTTPKPVLVEGCRFLGSSGSAILLAGDAQGWYESGRCLDVRIVNNLFDHNLIQRYQFTEGIISIYPMVKKPAAQKERYHRNIVIEGNTFLTHRVPLIYAISADGIIFRNNRVEFDNKHAPMHGGKPYVLQHCGETDLQEFSLTRLLPQRD